MPQLETTAPATAQPHVNLAANPPGRGMTRSTGSGRPGDGPGGDGGMTALAGPTAPNAPSSTGSGKGSPGAPGGMAGNQTG